MNTLNKDEVTKAPEVAVMRKLSTSLATAAEIERETYTGMLISLSGVLSLSARSLRSMAKPPETTDPRVLEDHEERLLEAQPEMRAYMLDTLVEHLCKAKEAIERDDMVTFRRWFELYRLD